MTKTGDALRMEIAAAKRLTREPRLAAVLDSMDEYLQQAIPPEDEDRKQRRRLYMRDYMRKRRARQREIRRAIVESTGNAE